MLGACMTCLLLRLSASASLAVGFGLCLKVPSLPNNKPAQAPSENIFKPPSRFVSTAVGDATRPTIILEGVTGQSALLADSPAPPPSHTSPLVVWWFGDLVVWWFGGLVVWWFGGLVVWWVGGLVVRRFGGLVVWLFGGLVVRRFGAFLLPLQEPGGQLPTKMIQATNQGLPESTLIQKKVAFFLMTARWTIRAPPTRGIAEYPIAVSPEKRRGEVRMTSAPGRQWGLGGGGGGGQWGRVGGWGWGGGGGVGVVGGWELVGEGRCAEPNAKTTRAVAVAAAVGPKAVGIIVSFFQGRRPFSGACACKGIPCFSLCRGCERKVQPAVSLAHKQASS